MISKDILISKKLSTFPDLIQGILVGRLMFQNNDPEKVIASRKRAFASLGIDLKNVVIQRQEHGNKVRVVQEKDRGAGVFDPKTYLRGTDGMITSKPNIFLVVHTADCVPISFYDPKKKVIAIAHAGWKGTAERVGQRTVLEMKRIFSCNPRDIIAYIGPSIGPCCYSVDLWKANKKQLLEAGILEKNIEESRICTCCSKLNLPSHYKEGEKRNRSILSVIGLKSYLVA